MHMAGPHLAFAVACLSAPCDIHRPTSKPAARMPGFLQSGDKPHAPSTHGPCRPLPRRRRVRGPGPADNLSLRSEEHTSELQSLMRISYAVFCLKKKKKQ